MEKSEDAHFIFLKTFVMMERMYIFKEKVAFFSAKLEFKNPCKSRTECKYVLLCLKPLMSNFDINPWRTKFSAHPIVERLPSESFGH